MLNHNLLVITVPQGQDTASCRVPQGVWTEFYTGKEYIGGSLTVEKAPGSDIIILVRENSVIIKEADGNTGCELIVYALCNGIRVDADVYGEAGEPELCVSFKRNGHSIHIASDGEKPYTVRMVNMYAKSAANGLVVIDGNDSVVTPDEGACTMELIF